MKGMLTEKNTYSLCNQCIKNKTLINEPCNPNCKNYKKRLINKESLYAKRAIY